MVTKGAAVAGRQCLTVAPLLVAMTCCAAWVTPARPASRLPMRAADQDTMGELFTKYYRPLAFRSDERSDESDLW